MTKEILKPARCANEISQLLNKVLGRDRFPVDVHETALEWSKVKFPDDKITVIKGNSLGKFEGGLYKAPPGKEGWGIFYNTNIESEGRINFTIAHELGHYLMHRNRHLKNFECTSQQTLDWDSELGQIEAEANSFAATLLMPLDDYRVFLPASKLPNLDIISNCAERYGVSFTAAILRWLDYTSKTAMLVASRDGFILWSRSSKNAMKRGVFYKVRGKPPIPVPNSSLAYQNINNSEEKTSDIWFSSDCTEMTLISDKYDFTLSLLTFHNI